MRYSVELYDIESDGGVSSVPALAGEMVTVYGPSSTNGPSSTYGGLMQKARVLKGHLAALLTRS